MKKTLKTVRADDNIKGLVLRINSPGGDALAGDEIYHEVEKTAREKMLVTSMGNVAASGGYYIAMPSAHIFADPSTITGSIGIYGGKADFSGLHEKLDLGKELYTRGKFSGLLSTTRPFTPQEREKYMSHLKAMYDHFLSLVADNRNLPVDSIDNLGQGKVWVGTEAKQNGLVDKIGGLKEALDFTAERLNITDYRVKIYPEKRTLFDFPGGGLFSLLVKIFGNSKESDMVHNPLIPEDSFGLFTRLPYDIVIE